MAHDRPALDVCPWCGREHDAATNAGGVGDQTTPPEPGDVAVCWVCHWPSYFTADGLRRPTVDELAVLRVELCALLGAMAESWTPKEAARRILERGGD